MTSFDTSSHCRNWLFASKDALYHERIDAQSSKIPHAEAEESLDEDEKKREALNKIEG